MIDEAEEASEETTERSEGPTLGSRLRAARETRELAIEKIADELRIEEHVLVALEEDRLTDIEVAPVFVKGYIKQYGRLLKLDYDELRQAFYEQIDTEDVRLRPNSSIQLRDERQITIWIIAALAVLIVGAALLVWWLGADDVSVAGSTADPALTTDSLTAAPQAAGENQTPDPVSARTPEYAQPGSVTAPAQPSSPQPAPGELTTAVADTAQAAAGEPAPSAGFPAQNPAGAEITVGAPATPEPGSVPLVFEFSAESWLELEDGRGRRLYYDLAAADARLRFMALPPVQVLIGNAAAATITVEDQAYAIPAGSLRGNVASFVIAPAQD